MLKSGTKLSLLLALFVVIPGCRKHDGLNATSKEYPVINEGQASGVTSTILGPGETPPPMTGTSVDTTSNLTVVQEGTATTVTDSSLANALPPVEGGPTNIPMQPPPPGTSTTTTISPRPVTPTTPYPTARRRPAMPPPTSTQPPPEPAQPVPPEEEPTQTDTTGQAPPTQTQTDTAPTDTAPPPPPPPGFTGAAF